MSKENKPEDEPKNAVDAFLEGQAMEADDGPPEDDSNTRRIEVSEEDAAKLRESMGQNTVDNDDQEDEGSRRETVIDPAFDPSHPSQHTTTTWAFHLDRLGEIKVEDFEKKLYTKSLLNDTRVEFSIPLQGVGMSGGFRSLTNHERDLAFNALTKDMKSKIVGDVSTHFTMLQKYLISMMWGKIGEKVEKPYTPDQNKSLENQVEELQEYRKKYIDNVNTPRWGMILRMASIFQAKLMACDKAVDDKTFFNPAGSD